LALVFDCIDSAGRNPVNSVGDCVLVKSGEDGIFLKGAGNEGKKARVLCWSPVAHVVVTELEGLGLISVVLSNSDVVAGELFKSESVLSDGAIGFAILGHVSNELVLNVVEGSCGDSASECECEEGLHY